MKNDEWSWDSGDGVRLFAQYWAPDGRPKAVVCLVHGIGEHSGRYAHMGRAFTDAGFVLAGFDLRGHGRSGGPRGHTPSFDAYMDDIAGFVEQVRTRFPDLRRFLYGHSLGGFLVLDYVLRRGGDFAGVIVTSPPLRTAITEQKVKVALAKVFGVVVPSFSLSSGLDPNTLSRDAEVVKAYLQDPLVHDKSSFGLARGFLAAVPWIIQHAPEVSSPLLLMHGTADRLNDPKATEEFAARVEGECTLKLWEGLYHEVHNEPEQAEVFSFAIDWMTDHLKSS